jgi:2-dehydro-3-deoxyphosphogluconate aldolase/(4S)-4-hydroxy-2-oxoglutarate aldolase
MTALSDALRAAPIVGIVRTTNPGTAEPVARAIAAGGIRAIEVALTSPDALDAIRSLAADKPPETVIGAGSIRSVDDVHDAYAAGAEFLVTPATQPEVLAAAGRYLLPVFCGAFSPTEMHLAQSAGAAYIKVFPAGELGPAYLSSVRAPMPELLLVPTGGVTIENVREWFRHGATAVAVGGGLVPDGAVERADYPAIEQRAAEFVAALPQTMPDALR